MLPGIGIGTGSGGFSGSSGASSGGSFGSGFDQTEGYRFAGDFNVSTGLKTRDLLTIGGIVLALGVVIVLVAR